MFENLPIGIRCTLQSAKYVKITCGRIAGTYGKNAVRFIKLLREAGARLYKEDKHIAETVPWELEKQYAIPVTRATRLW